MALKRKFHFSNSKSGLNQLFYISMLSSLKGKHHNHMSDQQSNKLGLSGISQTGHGVIYQTSGYSDILPG